ncbi:MAG TPA: AAA family ATPase [Frankiaceae bacterium]|nr:AAA family ATPase [Frankiaceae bacterium]
MTAGAVVVVAGLQAVGKSTVARLLAQRYERGAYVEGDVFYRMVVSGRADMTPAPSDEAIRQLRLRYRQQALVAASFATEGFVAVLATVVDARHAALLADEVAPHDLRLVWLDAPDDVVAARERERATHAYDGWLAPDGDLVAAVGRLRAQVGPPPPGALVVDTTGRTPDQTAADVYEALR